jgi:hypothetical protein
LKTRISENDPDSGRGFKKKNVRHILGVAAEPLFQHRVGVTTHSWWVKSFCPCIFQAGIADNNMSTTKITFFENIRDALKGKEIWGSFFNEFSSLWTEKFTPMQYSAIVRT